MRIYYISAKAVCVCVFVCMLPSMQSHFAIRIIAECGIRARNDHPQSANIAFRRQTTTTTRSFWFELSLADSTKWIIISE